MVRRERRDLAVERIDLVAPAAMQDHDRPSGAGIAIAMRTGDTPGKNADEERSMWGTKWLERYAKVSRIKL